jgi:hypothetical protein
MILTVMCSALWLASGVEEPAPPAEGGATPEQYAPMDAPQMPEMPGSVEEALGVEESSLWRKVGLAGVVTGGGLLAVSAAAFTFGLDAERELQSEPHTRAEVDSLLLQRGVFAAVGWPSLALGVVGLGAGVTMLVLDDSTEDAQ